MELLLVRFNEGKVIECVPDVDEVEADDGCVAVAGIAVVVVVVVVE